MQKNKINRQRTLDTTKLYNKKIIKIIKETLTISDNVAVFDSNSLVSI